MICMNQKVKHGCFIDAYELRNLADSSWRRSSEGVETTCIGHWNAKRSFWGTLWGLNHSTSRSSVTSHRL